MARPRDFYEVLGVGRDASADESSARTASWPAPTTRTSTRTPAPRTASRRSPRPTTCCPIPSIAQPLRRLRARLPPGPRGRRPADTGLAPGPGPGSPGAAARRSTRTRRTGRRVVHLAPRGIDFEELFGGFFAGGGRRRSWGPIAGADQEAELDAHRRGGVPRRAAVDHALRAGRPADARGDDPARRHRRAAHPARRPGRPGHRRGAGRRPLPRRAPRAAPPLPGRGTRHLRRTAAGAVGGGARRLGRRRHAGRRGQGAGARRARRAGDVCG